MYGFFFCKEYSLRSVIFMTNFYGIIQRITKNLVPILKVKIRGGNQRTVQITYRSSGLNVSSRPVCDLSEKFLGSSSLEVQSRHNFS